MRSLKLWIPVLAAGLLLVCCSKKLANEVRPDPKELLREVQARYDSMQSYSSVGVVTGVFDMSPSSIAEALEGVPASVAARPEVAEAYRQAVQNLQKSEHKFTVKLGRPQLYKVDWEQRVAPDLIMKGAAWSSGSGNFVAAAGQPKPFQPESTVMALAMATGISGGAAGTVPSAFFGFDHSPFKLLSESVLAPDDIVDDDPCYVIQGDIGGQHVTLWISKRSGLLRQQRTDFAGHMEMPEFDDETMTATLKSLNKEPTAEEITKMRTNLEAARKMRLDGFAIETHREIKVDFSFAQSDFRSEAAEGNQK